LVKKAIISAISKDREGITNADLE